MIDPGSGEWLEQLHAVTGSRRGSDVAFECSGDRVRVGDYRILYEVIDARLVIQVVRVGYRRDVYRPR